MLTTLFLNLCILTAGAFALSFTHRIWPAPHAGPWFALRLVGLGALGVLLMQFPAPLAPGVIADLRAVPLVYAALMGGPVAGLAVAVPTVIYRLMVGGVGAPVMVLSTLSMLLVCSLLFRHAAREGQLLRPWQPVLALLPNGLGLLLLPHGTVLFAHVYLPLLVMSLGGYVVLRQVMEARLRLLAAVSRLTQQATVDALTGIANRRQFDHDLTRLGAADALVLIDIDHFKQINDSYGHPVGDAVLQEVAQRLLTQLRRDDRVYRYGGEEFAVILRGVGAGQAAAVAARLRGAVGSTSHIGLNLTVTVSCGVAVFGGQDSALLVAQADRALYQAKEAGRDRVEVWGHAGAVASGLAVFAQ